MNDQPTNDDLTLDSCGEKFFGPSEFLGDSICQNCNLTFDNNEQLTSHSCIKQEEQDSKENQVNIFEPAPGQLLDVKIEEKFDADENKPLKVKKTRRKTKKGVSLIDFPTLPSHLMENYHDLELSEEFLINILKYVDELCNTISNGDPILERTMIINQNLINSVSFYRSVLDDVKNKPEDIEYFDENEALSDHDQGVQFNTQYNSIEISSGKKDIPL